MENNMSDNYIPTKYDRVMPDGRILIGYYDNDIPSAISEDLYEEIKEEWHLLMMELQE